LWGAPILIGDIMQGMPWTRQPDGSLIYATSGAGNLIYRGHRLPADLVGDYLYGEVSGRIVRRLRPVKTEGLTQLRNAYTRSEFIRSIDPLFRPVYSATAPDGTIYIADMYRGIIEGAQWAKTGTYLRAKIEQYGLDRIVNGRGRIWRLTYDGMAPDRRQPRMFDETSAQLVAHLAHPNGWWRDTAQQNLVLRQDRSVVPALEAMARTAAAPQPPGAASGPGGTNDVNQLARIHALWTLEGLGALAPALVHALLDDSDPAIRIQAIRVSETLYKGGDKSFGDRYRALARVRDTDVVIQAMLTLHVLEVADAASAVKTAMSANTAAGVQFVADRILNPPPTGLTAGAGVRTPEEAGVLGRGGTIYSETCFTCHGDDGRGTPDPSGGAGSIVAPSLAGSPRVLGHRDYVVKAIVHGLTGPIDGRTYSQVMVPLGANRDEWIADVASYVRNSFGNTGSFVTPADVARVRTASASRGAMWTVSELEASLPRLLVPDAAWAVTASHEGQPEIRRDNPAGGFNFTITASGALTFLGWTTGVPQEAGMWLQVELPAPVSLVEIQFTSSASGGGRGGPPPDSLHPRGYRVETSMDGTTWGAPVAEGAGVPGLASITFPAVTARFVRITQTASVAGAPPWFMRMLRLYQEPAAAR
jgi:mono/diheme cytochrome c family protein